MNESSLALAAVALVAAAFDVAPEEVEAITLSNPVLTFIEGDVNAATLALTLSGATAAGDFASFVPRYFSLHAAGRYWSFDAATASISGTAVTIVGLVGTVVDDDYSTDDDVLIYGGLDGDHFPAVSNAALAVAFGGGALAAKVSAGYDDPGNIIAAQLTRDIAAYSTTPGHFAAWYNNHRLVLGGNASRSAAAEVACDTVSEGDVALHADEMWYSGKDALLVDTASPPQPVPPFKVAMTAA